MQTMSHTIKCQNPADHMLKPLVPPVKHVDPCRTPHYGRLAELIRKRGCRSWCDYF